MNDEAFKQDIAGLDCGHVDSFFCLGCRCDPVSVELWFCWAAIFGGYSSGVDNVLV